MNCIDMPSDRDNSNGLALKDVNGEPRIRDLDLAIRLGFSDAHKIRNLIERHADALVALGVSATVAETSPKGGRPGKAHYLNRKQAIFITAKSETPEATEITIEIIERFDAYERGAMAPQFAIPQTLSEALRLAADQADTIEQQKAEIEATKPVVAAFDRIANADGNVNMTLAAKALQVSPHWFMKWCDTNGWTYKRGNQRMAYQDKVNAGYLHMKTDTVERPDGSDKAVYQVFVTPKGLTKLAKLLSGSGGAPATLPLLRPNGLGGSSVHHAPAME